MAVSSLTLSLVALLEAGKKEIYKEYSGISREM